MLFGYNKEKGDIMDIYATRREILRRPVNRLARGCECLFAAVPFIVIHPLVALAVWGFFYRLSGR
jgi:hypothetical protein